MSYDPFTQMDYLDKDGSIKRCILLAQVWCGWAWVSFGNFESVVVEASRLRNI